MATFYVTVDFLGGDSPGLTRTQNVTVGDTVIVNFRGLGPEDLIFGTNANCSVTNNGAGSPPGATQFTVNSFSGSSYSAQFTDDDGQTWTLVGSVTAGEIYPASPTASNYNISTSATSLSVPISGGVPTAEAYSLCVTPGLTTNVQVVDDRISAMTPYSAGATFSITGGDLPTYGQTKNYYIYSYRYPAYGGAGQYYYASSFYVFRPFIPPSTSATCSNTTIAATYTGSLTLPLLNADFADEAYRLCRTGGYKTYSQIVADQIGSTIFRGSATTFTIIDSELPTAGNTEDYTVYAYRYPDAGGQGVYVEAGTFYVTRSSASDTTPDAFNLGGPVTEAELSTSVFSDTITVSGINASTPISISGTGSPTYSINGGGFTSASGTVLNGNTVQVRVTSSASNSASVTATLNIGGVTDTFTATTLASGGGGVTPGNNTYGLEVFGPNGSIVFSPNFKVCNLAILTAFSLPAGGFQDFACDSAQFANRVVTIVDTGSRLSNQKIVVTRQTNNIRLTNTHTSAIAGQLVAIRIA